MNIGFCGNSVMWILGCFPFSFSFLLSHFFFLWIYRIGPWVLKGFVEPTNYFPIIIQPVYIYVYLKLENCNLCLLTDCATRLSRLQGN